MKYRYHRLAAGVIAAAALSGCSSGGSTDIGNDMAFAWYDSYDYTNLYHGGDPRDGGVPVIPGGCDSARWNDRYVLTKGEHWRYANWARSYQKPAIPATSFVFFVIEKAAYHGGQELDPALHGPLTPAQQAAWERRIPGPYREP